MPLQTRCPAHGGKYVRREVELYKWQYGRSESSRYAENENGQGRQLGAVLTRMARILDAHQIPFPLCNG